MTNLIAVQGLGKRNSIGTAGYVQLLVKKSSRPKRRARRITTTQGGYHFFMRIKITIQESIYSEAKIRLLRNIIIDSGLLTHISRLISPQKSTCTILLTENMLEYSDARIHTTTQYSITTQSHNNKIARRSLQDTIIKDDIPPPDYIIMDLLK